MILRFLQAIPQVILKVEPAAKNHPQQMLCPGHFCPLFGRCSVWLPLFLSFNCGVWQTPITSKKCLILFFKFTLDFSPVLLLRFI